MVAELPPSSVIFRLGAAQASQYFQELWELFAVWYSATLSRLILTKSLQNKMTP